MRPQIKVLVLSSTAAVGMLLATIMLVSTPSTLAHPIQQTSATHANTIQPASGTNITSINSASFYISRTDSKPQGGYVSILNSTLSATYPSIAAAIPQADKQYEEDKAFCASTTINCHSLPIGVGNKPGYTPFQAVGSNITVTEAAAAISNLEAHEVIEPDSSGIVIHEIDLQYNGNFYTINLITR